MPKKHALVVLISGRGSNLQAIIDAALSEELGIEIAAVISNRSDAKGLEHAKQAGIPTQVVDHHLFTERDAFDLALKDAIESYRPELVLLAGFMRILGPEFVAHYSGRLLNIHPSLLPELRGLNTHQRALSAGLKEHGASVHFVTGQLDGGPVIIQASVPVDKNDTEAELAARVLSVEHLIYPAAVKLICSGRLYLEQERIYFDNRPLEQPLSLAELE